LRDGGLLVLDTDFGIPGSLPMSTLRVFKRSPPWRAGGPAVEEENSKGAKPAMVGRVAFPPNLLGSPPGSQCLFEQSCKVVRGFLEIRRVGYEPCDQIITDRLDLDRGSWTRAVTVAAGSGAP
jgi:hypothetical protein